MEAKQSADRLAGLLGRPLTISQIAVVANDLQKTIDTVQGLVDAGATHLILNLRYPYPDNIVARLAEEVVPRIKG